MSKRFEELTVRQSSQELINKLGIIFYHEKFRNRSFQDQIMRASISIANNIAEGNERGSDKDFMRFLYYAKGSAGEVRSMLYSAYNFKYIDSQTFTLLKEESTSMCVKIHNFIKVLHKRITKNKG